MVSQKCVRYWFNVLYMSVERECGVEELGCNIWRRVVFGFNSEYAFVLHIFFIMYNRIWRIIMAFSLVKNTRTTMVLLWLQEPTKNKIGNGRNGGRENLGSNDEVGCTASIVFIETSNVNIKTKYFDWPKSRFEFLNLGNTFLLNSFVLKINL